MGVYSLPAAGKAPFEVDLGYVPTSPTSFLFPAIEPDATRSAVDITEILERLQDTALAAHQAAFHDAKFFYDKRRTDKQFEAGQEVYLDLSQLGKQLDAHNSSLLPKLRTKFAGPFTIDKVLSPVNYQLIMPPFYTRHPVFHISHLRLKHRIPDAYFVSPHSSTPLKQYKDGTQAVEMCTHYSSVISHGSIPGP
ncbi:hypothetical protein OXX59_005252 [Metschnikowia pulcherrima]